MLGSQQDATAAALCYLNINFTTINTVASTVKGTPAYGVLQTGDDITAVDGTPGQLPSQRRHHDPGIASRARRVTLTIDRKGGDQDHHADDQGRRRPAGGRGRAGRRQTYEFPFTVKINLADIGGPSAGMMFALGIIDKLTPHNLTGGKFIAGTGEIAPTGDDRADRRHPAEDGRCQVRRRHDLPDAGRQLLEHHRRRASRAAAGARSARWPRRSAICRPSSRASRYRRASPAAAAAGESACTPARLASPAARSG